MIAIKDGVLYRIEGSTNLSAFTAGVEELYPSVIVGPAAFERLRISQLQADGSRPVPVARHSRTKCLKIILSGDLQRLLSRLDSRF